MPSMLSVREERRSRSKSPGGRERERSRSGVRDDADDDRRRERTQRSTRRHSDSESDRSAVEDSRRYSSTKPSKQYYDPPSDDDRRRQRRSKYDDDDDRDEDRYQSTRSRKEEPRSRHRRSDSESDHDRRDTKQKESKKDLPAAYAYAQQPTYGQPPPGAFPDATRHMSYSGHDPRYGGPPAAQYADPSQRPRATSSAGAQYADPRQFQYAQVDSRVKYKYDDKKIPDRHDTKSHSQKYHDDDDVITPEQLNARMREKKQADDKYKQREVRSVHDEPYSRDPIYRDKDDIKDTARRVSRLSMSGAAAAGAGLGASLAVAGHAAPMGGGKPPASPLLEAYKGTYQSISPMPSALVLANHKDDSDLSDFDLGEDDASSGIDDTDPNADLKRKIWKLEREKVQHEKAEERNRKKLDREKEREKQKEYDRVRPQDPRHYADSDVSHMALVPSAIKSPRGSRKSVSFYDAEDDAREIAAALKGNRPPVIKPLIRILPALSIDDLDALKAEYKKHAKIDGQGINLSKHIKARVPGYVGKAAYACSLGQWESEGFWANCYYQAGASRRELLIESLMGRTNQQIREIKNFFKDKKYDDDLEKCMKTELKADKFRSAIMLALEERRMPETAPIDPRLVKEDVRELYDTLNGPGGESALIQVIVLRSDAHLRQVLRLYEQIHGRNFARDMINKSRNLVGETLAHILNGALNRPMRDALLIHQAISETAPGKERAELLISRLVRLHWEPRHLERVKEQYATRYGRSVESAIKKEIQANMKTEEGLNWTTFCINLLRSSEQ